MRIRQLRVSSFRGWRQLDLRPGHHSLVVGAPRAGRSDLIEALRRVLDPDSTRVLPGEFDVYRPTAATSDDDRDADAHDGSDETNPVDGADSAEDEVPVVHRAEVEVVLADLGEALEQHFYRRLELWDRDKDALLAESTADQITEDRHDLVLRLCYRLRWSPEEGPASTGWTIPRTPTPTTSPTTVCAAQIATCSRSCRWNQANRWRCGTAARSANYSTPKVMTSRPCWVIFRMRSTESPMG